MEWIEDVLGAPYQAHEFDLGTDDEGPVVATLVRRVAGPDATKAVLHVHGFADYFFQTVAADFWVSQGYDFYAVDLRKYGRSLRDHQTPTYVDDLATYYEELDLAWSEIAKTHDHIVVSGHSTGGLVVALWLHDRQHPADGVFLNSPWIDMHGDRFTRHIAAPAVQRLGARAPKREIKRETNGTYAKTLHVDYNGEWPFDLRLKPLGSFKVYAGWIRAIRIGQQRIARGLQIEAPVLMVSSARSGHPPDPDHPDATSTDIVLDVEQMRRRAGCISRHVTIAMIDGALHDVTLSRQPAREHVFTEISTWLRAYVGR